MINNTEFSFAFSRSPIDRAASLSSLIGKWVGKHGCEYDPSGHAVVEVVSTEVGYRWRS